MNLGALSETSMTVSLQKINAAAILDHHGLFVVSKTQSLIVICSICPPWLPIYMVQEYWHVVFERSSPWACTCYFFLASALSSCISPNSSGSYLRSHLVVIPTWPRPMEAASLQFPFQQLLAPWTRTYSPCRVIGTITLHPILFRSLIIVLTTSQRGSVTLFQITSNLLINNALNLKKPAI